MTIGERIKSIRKSLGVTQEEFGAHISLGAPMISLLENGTAKITDRTAKSICNEYNVNYDWLINGNGEMYKQTPSDDTLIAKIKDIINLYPSLYETAKLVSSHMTNEDWKRLNVLLKEMGG